MVAMRALSSMSKEIGVSMASTNGKSTSELKIQAKRLKEFLNSLGTPLQHSHCLEAIAAIHGIKDWNTASAVTQKSLNTYVLCCSFETEDEPERPHFFQYVMRRESLHGLIEDFKQHMIALIAKDINETRMTKLYMEDIIEIDASTSLGVPLNLIIPSPEGSTLHCLLPFTKKQKGVQGLKYFPQDIPENEDDLPNEMIPILQFLNGKVLEC